MGDQRLVDMDDDEIVAIIEQPDGSMLDTPVRVAQNGGAGRIRSNAEGFKYASALDRAVKFKKQRLLAELLEQMCSPDDDDSEDEDEDDSEDKYDSEDDDDYEDKDDSENEDDSEDKVDSED
jgi:hypothetical protein